MDSSMALVSLSEVIEAVNIVNTETAERLRWGFPKDAVVNAIVILDCFVLLLPTAIEEDLQNLRADFAAAAVWPKS
jgi:hypothetical protein